DLGATKVAVVAGDRAQPVSARRPLPRGTTAAAELAAAAQHVHAVVQRSTARPAGVVIASAPELDVTGAVQAWPNRPAWHGLDVARAFSDAARAPVCAWLDDGCAGALAEWGLGGAPEFLYLAVGTGVGGAVVKDRVVVSVAGGIGHRDVGALTDAA